MLAVNPHGQKTLGDEGVEALPVPGTDQVNFLGKFPEFLSAALLSYAIGRKSLQGSPVFQRLARTYVDERAHGAGMTALKLVDEYILQVDPTVCGLPAFAQGFGSLESCLRKLGLVKEHGVTDIGAGSELYFLVSSGNSARFEVSWNAWAGWR